MLDGFFDDLDDDYEWSWINYGLFFLRKGGFIRYVEQSKDRCFSSRCATGIDTVLRGF